MSEHVVIETQKCAHTHVPVTRDMCHQLTSVVLKNHGGCCSTNCSSKWRACKQCVLLSEKDRSNGPVNPVTGLCAMHGGEIVQDVETPLEQITIGSEVLVIPADDIGPLPDQPRKHFDLERLNALADSIRHRGQVMPGIVIATPEAEWKYQLRDGERRLRACKIAGVPFRAVLQTSQDKGRNEALLTSAVANFNREGHTPWEEIDLVRRLLQPCPDTGVKFTQAQVAESLGHNNAMWISNRKVVGERLCAYALTYIADNPAIPFTIIKQVADLPDEEQVKTLREYLNGKIGGQKLTMIAAQHRRVDGISRAKRPSDFWDQGVKMIPTLEERAKRIADIFSPQSICGDLGPYAVEHGDEVAGNLERIASFLLSSAKLLRAAKR